LGEKDAQRPLVALACRMKRNKGAGRDSPKYTILTSIGGWPTVLLFLLIETQYKFSIPAPLLIQSRSVKTGPSHISWVDGEKEKRRRGKYGRS
jgi:hypothetical protein